MAERIVSVKGGILIEVAGSAKVQEITAALQSFLHAGFLSAAQVEVEVMIENESFHPVTKAVGLRSFRNFVPKQAFSLYS